MAEHGDNLFGGVFYINLDKRADRRVEFEAEMAKVGLNAERFSAIEMRPGIVGCGYSHLAVLKLARDRGLKNVLIFEDDFEFLVPAEEFWTDIKAFFRMGLRYDVAMLAHNLHASHPFNDLLLAVDYATTASAYIVNSYFYDALIELYEKNLPLLAATGQHWIYANDQIWRLLQARGGWVAFAKRLGKQRASYSDNSLAFMDHGV
jgi:GR25 family glycosyltransferase involved in LPS biosynthesis